MSLLLSVVLSPLCAEIVTHCPPQTAPIRTADANLPWACALTEKRARDWVNCPPGSHSVTTTDPYNPFRCVLEDVVLRAPRGLCPSGHRAVPSADPQKDYECEKVSGGFAGGPSCPRGTRPVATPGQLQPFRCFADEKAKAAVPTAEPVFRKTGPKPRSETPPKTCPKGMSLEKTEDPFAPVQCVPKGAPARAPTRFRRFEKKNEMAFQYPEGWDVTDGWTDEVPTVYFMLLVGRQGKPVSLTVTRQRKGSPSYQDLRAMIDRDKEWHKAVESEGAPIDGLRAAHLAVEKESDTAYVDTGDGYFVLSYSAPPDLYATYEPAYRRLLKSFSFLGKRGDAEEEAP